MQKTHESSTIDDLSNHDRRRRLDYAKELARVAAGAPYDDLKKRVNGLANSIRQEYGFTHRAKVAEVAYHNALGCWTVEDLVHSTGFKWSDVQECLNELVACSKVRKTKPDAPGNGRPAFLYRPIDD